MSNSSIWPLNRTLSGATTLGLRIDLGMMVIKGYLPSPKAKALPEPHHQIILCHNQVTRGGSLTLLQRCNRCILQPQLTGPSVMFNCKKFYFKQLSLTYTVFWVVYAHLNIKTVLFQVIQFSIRIQLSSIWPIDRTLSGVATLGQKKPKSDGKGY